MSRTPTDPLNQHLLSEARQCLTLYKMGELNLPSLANHLFFVFDRLTDFSLKSKRELMQFWEVVEEVNALALDEGLDKALLEHEEILNRALNGIKNILDEDLE
jgi:hypothetical protein